MVKFAIMKDTGEFVKTTLTSTQRYKFVPTVEKAELFDDKHTANNVLLSIKFKNVNEFNHCRLVEVEIQFNVKEVE